MTQKGYLAVRCDPSVEPAVRLFDPVSPVERQARPDDEVDDDKDARIAEGAEQAEALKPAGLVQPQIRVK
jgi:hypothetical protein